jgi:toxin ParE1/3/4
MRIRWTNPARRAFAAHVAYIAADNPDVAERVCTAIVVAVERLTDQPHLGRIGRRAGTRELVIASFPAYIVVYRVTETDIRITRVWHRRQNWQREQ